MSETEKSNSSLDYVICKVCEGNLENKGFGVYVCEDCHNIVLDDLGKARAYVEECGLNEAQEMAEQINVPLLRIQEFLSEGRLELPEGSQSFVCCQKCGCSIRYGRYCKDCSKEIAGEIAKELKHTRRKKQRK